MVTWIGSDSVAPPEDESTPYLERDAKRNVEVGPAVHLDGIEATMKRTNATRKR